MYIWEIVGLVSVYLAPRLSLSSLVFPPSFLITVRVMSSPLDLLFMRVTSSASLLISLPFILVRMSPILIPAFPAEDPFSTSVILRPLSISSTAMPMNPLPRIGFLANGPSPMNSPFFMVSQWVWKTWMGTCMLTSVTPPTRLWMPMRVPFMSNSGPPESPPMRVQSDWMVFSAILTSLPSLRPLPRSLSNPPEWPSEKTQSPSLVLALSRSLAGSMLT